MSTETEGLQHIEQVDWSNWVPDQTATLIFVVQNGQILLIRKKRGLGAGKINGPGGRIDPGETPEEGAIREAQEELHITPTGVRFSGELFFQFADGFKLHGYVFHAGGHEGTPTETDEATPIWTPLDRIPYDDMWADDRYWFPFMLDGRLFTGKFLFNDDTMLGYELTAHA